MLFSHKPETAIGSTPQADPRDGFRGHGIWRQSSIGKPRNYFKLMKSVCGKVDVGIGYNTWAGGSQDLNRGHSYQVQAPMRCQSPPGPQRLIS